MPEVQRTLMLIKPDAVNRGLIGRILQRYEDKGFNFVGIKMILMTRQQGEELYAPHVGKPFYEPTIGRMTSFPVLATVIEGYDAVNQVRRINGATNPAEAEPGTVRGDYGQQIEWNCVHGSDSVENAEREIPIFFESEEMLDYRKCLGHWHES